MEVGEGSFSTNLQPGPHLSEQQSTQYQHSHLSDRGYKVNLMPVKGTEINDFLGRLQKSSRLFNILQTVTETAEASSKSEPKNTSIERTVVKSGSTQQSMSRSAVDLDDLPKLFLLLHCCYSSGSVQASTLLHLVMCLCGYCCCLVTKSCPTIFQPQGRQPTRLLCPWDFPGKNTGVSYLTLFQGIFLTEGSNSGLLLCRRILYQLSHKESPGRTLVLLKFHDTG